MVYFSLALAATFSFTLGNVFSFPIKDEQGSAANTFAKGVIRGPISSVHGLIGSKKGFISGVSGKFVSGEEYSGVGHADSTIVYQHQPLQPIVYGQPQPVPYQQENVDTNTESF